MRVTDHHIYSSARKHAMSARSKMDRAVNVAATGLQVARPWDDAYAAGTVSLHRSHMAAFDSIARTNEQAADELMAVDGMLDQATNLFTRARELAVQLSNDSYSPAQRQEAALEVAQLQEALAGIANHKHGDRYIFGGHQDQSEPIDATGTFVGDSGIRRIEIAPGVFEAMSIRSDVAFAGAGGGVDLFGVLGDLEAALQSGDSANIRATLADIDTGTGQLSTARAETGNMMRTLDTAVAVSKQMSDQKEVASANLVEADLIEATTNLAQTQNALNASLTAVAKGFELSLLDRMR